MGNAFLILTLVVAGAMVLLWLVQVKTRDAGVVDVCWAFGLAFAAGLFAWLAPGDPTRRAVVGLVAGIWALRLGIYLLLNRVIRAEEEDGRYRHMRQSMGRWAQPGFFAFFQLQTGFVVLFALPIWAAMANAAPALGWLDLLGVVIGLGAILGEAVADRQLAHFRARADSRGRTCKRGLWRYSRHPNYFFEICHWFAYAAFAAGGPLWWLACLGPVIILVFIWKITGVPFTEQRARSHRSDYAAYQRTTSMIIPWKPKPQD